MQIRTQVIVGTGVSLLLALLLGVGLWEVERRTAREIARAETVSEVIRSAFDLTVLTAEFLDTRHVRAQHQWWASERRLSRALQRLSVTDGLEQDLVVGMRAERERSSALFAVMDGGGWEGVDVVDEALVHQAAGQIVIALRHLSSQAEQLDHLLRTRLMRLQQLSRRVGGGAGALLALVVLLAAVHTRSGLVTPMARLLQGMRDVGEGNLAQRVGTDRNDEIGELSRAFDQMTNRLQETMASREALAREMAVRQQAEAALRASEERFRQLAENVHEVFWMTSADGQKFLYVSPAYDVVWQRVRERLMESPDEWLEAVHPEDRARVRAAGHGVAVTGPFDEEYRLLRADGTVCWIRDRGFPVRDGAGRIVRVAGIAENITEAKLARDALTRHSEELERSNRDLEEFAYAASHDLQEPLRKIEAFGSLLASRFSDRLPEEGRDYLNRMQGAARRMRALIEDLLAFSRITTRARPFTAVDLRHTVDEVLCDLEALVRDAGGQVTIGDLPLVHAEPVQMRQLLQNLIGNALKFRREGVAPVVQVYAESLSGVESGGHGRAACRLVVEDNGIGFDEKYHDRIFGLFQRLHGRSEYTGTGIGLALCRKIVDRHRGTIVAHSSPGQGTRFEVTLPLASDGGAERREGE